MPGGWDTRRAVQIVVRGEGRVWFGSGYLVTPTLILTAAHVADSGTVAVRFVRSDRSVLEIQAAVVWSHTGSDMAVLRLDGVAPVAADEPARFGRVIGSCAWQAVGFPWFKMRDSAPSAGAAAVDGAYRDSHHAHGTLQAGSNQRSGTLELVVAAPPAQTTPDHSPWAGMSGAAVFADGVIVGVVTDHQWREGPGLLAAHAIADRHTDPSADHARSLRTLLEFPEPGEFSEVGGTGPESSNRDVVGLPVTLCQDPFAFEVHPAIAVPNRRDLPRLPLYVARGHDDELADIVTDAEAGHSRMALLIGGSGAGKTRACWEAVQRLGEGWRLWHPVAPDRPEALLAGLERIRPRTVLWLNELQRYLLTRGSQLGEHSAAGLRDLLRDPGRAPVLVLGTMWPAPWERLTREPSGEDDDPHAQARELLAIADDIRVPDTFGGRALRDLREKAEQDERLSEALRHGTGSAVTQFLAGAPELLKSYRNAEPEARALIDAAVDARRLGHAPELPEKLLRDAAAGYLNTGHQDGLDQDAARRAFAAATSGRRGIDGPLRQVPTRSEAPDGPTYLLSDYLEQVVTAERRPLPIPPELWLALVDHAHPGSLLAIADSAQARGMLFYELGFIRIAAATTADANAWWRLESAYRRLGVPAEADACVVNAAKLGDPPAMREAARTRARTNGLNAALSWLRTLPGGESPEALAAAADLLTEAGKTRRAARYYRRAYQGNQSPQIVGTESLREAAGRIAERSGSSAAERWLSRLEIPAALCVAASMCEKERESEALAYYRKAVELGEVETGFMWHAGNLLVNQGRPDEALRWFRSAALRAPGAMAMAATLLDEAGFKQESLTAYVRVTKSRGASRKGRGRIAAAVSALQNVGMLDDAVSMCERLGSGLALEVAGEALAEAGRLDEAFALHTRAGRLGVTRAWWRAGELRDGAHREAEAIELYKKSADVGVLSAEKRAASSARARMRQTCRRLDELGRGEEALAWLSERASKGDARAIGAATDWLVEARGLDDAVAWCSTRGAEVQPGAKVEAARLLFDAQRHDEALALYREAADAGDESAIDVLSSRLQASGRVDEAVVLLESMAERGVPQSLWRLARLLEDAGGDGSEDLAIESYARSVLIAEGGLSEICDLLDRTERHHAARVVSVLGLTPDGRVDPEWFTQFDAV